MMRTATRLLLAGCVAVALALGMTGTSGAATAERPTGQTSEVAAKAAGTCAEQKAKVTKARKDVRKSDRLVAKAKKAKKQADTAQQKKQADRKLAKAKKQQKKDRKALKKAKAQLRTCQKQSGGGGGSGGDPTPEVQCLEAGLPAEVCGALGQLPTPEPGGDSPIQPLCDQGLPQAICDAATLPSPDGETSPIQPLCDAGLPQEICDASAPGGESPVPEELCSLPIPLPICDLVGRVA